MLKNRLGVIFAAVALIVAASATPALAADHGPYRQIQCRVYAVTGGAVSCTTKSIEPHSSAFWLRTRVNCVNGSASYTLWDAQTLIVVATGSCSNGGTSGWKTTYGLYNMSAGYKMTVRGNAPVSAFGFVANCTTGCTIIT